MSGICGGHLGGQRDLTDAQDAMYQRQIDRIRAEEAQPTADDVIDLMDVLQRSLAKSKSRGRRPRTKSAGHREGNANG